MRLITGAVAVGLALAAGTLPLRAQQSPREVAERFVRQLAAAEWEAATALVGPRMQQAGVTSQLLEQTWQHLSSTGALGALELAATASSGGYEVIDFLATFGSVRHVLRISVDAEGRVEGFRLLPANAPQDFPPPPYAAAGAFEEVALEVGAAGWPLGATLALPKGVARAPVVVLVHGSGAHDRDETLAGNKPFRDLAHGLASRGVAVLRYEKRNWKHAARMVAQASFTVDDEVIDDAVAALAQVRAHPRVDAARVYLLGHSLGAMLAPGIAVRDGRVAGVILLAGSPRRLPELVLEQLAYIGALPENAAPAAQQQIAELRTLMERIERREIPPQEQAMGAPASYFYDLADRDALAFLAQLRAPVLVLHGGRDYQVTERDFEAYRAALAERSDARFRIYPELNHLFMPGTGRATPAEYAASRGHVDVRVIEDIASFVRGGR